MDLMLVRNFYLEEGYQCLAVLLQLFLLKYIMDEVRDSNQRIAILFGGKSVLHCCAFLLFMSEVWHYNFACQALER